MKVITTRFGEIEIDNTKVIEMTSEILGFEGRLKFTLVKQEENAPFMWLQSIEDGALAFVVVNPQLIKPDYEPEINDEDAENLQLTSSNDVMMLAIVTINTKTSSVTANLRAPVVINTALRKARQIVLEDADYPIRYELTNKEENAVVNAGK